MTTPDPWLVLGLAPGSSLADARAARRRLAKQLHPDLHTEGPPAERADVAARMSMANRALAEIEGAMAATTPGTGREDPLGAPGPAAAPDAAARQVARPVGAADPDSFSVECLPVEAFEVLFLAAYGLGDIVVADEPYLLEVYLTEPACFCRLTLVPEAGGSLVTIEVSPAAESVEGPQPSAVIDVLVAELNALATVSDVRPTGTGGGRK